MAIGEKTFRRMTKMYLVLIEKKNLSDEDYQWLAKVYKREPYMFNPSLVKLVSSCEALLHKGTVERISLNVYKNSLRRAELIAAFETLGIEFLVKEYDYWLDITKDKIEEFLALTEGKDFERETILRDFSPFAVL